MRVSERQHTTISRVSIVRARPACCPIRIKVLTLKEASLNGKRGRRNAVVVGSVGENALMSRGG